MTDARKCYNFKSSVLTPQGIECYKIPETNSFLVTRAPKDTTRFETYALKIAECDITLAGIHYTAICMLLGDTMIGIEQQLNLCKKGICSFSSPSARRIRHEMPIYKAALIRWLRNHGINFTIGAAHARGTLSGVIYDLGYDRSTVHNIDAGQDQANATIHSLNKYNKNPYYKVPINDCGDRVGTWHTLVVDKEHWNQHIDSLPKGPYVETSKDYILWCLSNAHTASPHEMPTSEFMQLLYKFDRIWLEGGLFKPTNLLALSQFIKLVHKMLIIDHLDVGRVREIIRNDDTLLEHTNSSYEHIDGDKYLQKAGHSETMQQNSMYVPIDGNAEGTWVLVPQNRYQEVERLIRLNQPVNNEPDDIKLLPDEA